MKAIRRIFLAALLCLPVLAAPSEKEVRDAMAKAEALRNELSGLMTKTGFRAHWAEDDSRLIYQINEGGGKLRYHEVDLATGKSVPAFDIELLAKALGNGAEADKLALTAIQPVPGGKMIRFRHANKRWQWDPTAHRLSEDQSSPAAAKPDAPSAHRRSGNSDVSTELMIENKTGENVELVWVDFSGRAQPFGEIKAAATRQVSTYAEHVWQIRKRNGEALASMRATANPVLITFSGKIAEPERVPADRSPDGKWRASFQNHNLQITSTAGGDALPVTTDGVRSHSYSGPIQWSPDSKGLIVWRTRHVESRKVHIVESSPTDQLQPKLKTIDYVKPGDGISQRQPVLIDVSGGRPQVIALESTLFDQAWSMDRGEWRADSEEFQFLYNARGHQTMRVIGIAAKTGKVRVVHQETSKTFIDYSQKTWMHRIAGTDDFLWFSERDGFNHLYRIDGKAGRVKKKITSGEWNIRRVRDVKEEDGRLELLIESIGMDPANPYHSHYGRIIMSADGSVKATRLTESAGHHEVDFSPAGKWVLATWSRPDQPPVTELRRADNGKILAELNRVDDAALLARGWHRPERFVSKGRDGKTDIHGLIIRPTNFDPSKRYPVIEDIYAGPHDFFTPQRFNAWFGMQSIAELGFIVVKLDGMGTNWRNKAFHDVAWKNLKDSGFPDRIPWIKAAAETRPWMDLTRVGIFGGSAGGQSALSALLHHGDFYHVAVSDCGCHDNRMDKIWWNEAWMGWPVDESYADSSNVTHAPKLNGKLMLIVGELDTNVDPASTAQVVAALQREGKLFDFVPIMNAGHGAAETPYGRFRRAEFLMKHLLNP